ncbi:hypothetical protein G9464_20820 [Halostella sp. JP-L12]|uniref:hypothetical protein n=1 Tax=Halostella TaxID=1843185 RepID=UPI0013CF3619|nr:MULTISPECIES: hypothetical protein [Halostella]NHN50015.1 hypothetical protein [Halostella sp. JP-L12]
MEETQRDTVSGVINQINCRGNVENPIVAMVFGAFGEEYLPDSWPGAAIGIEFSEEYLS